MVIFEINNIITNIPNQTKREYSTEYAVLQNNFFFPKKKAPTKRRKKKGDMKGLLMRILLINP